MNKLETEKKPTQEMTDAKNDPAIARLKELGIADVDYALTLLEEGEQLNAEVFWVRFSSPEDQPEMPSVEGKIYFPRENNNGELVMFVPGYPGGKAGRWERIYGESLLNEGYTFVSLRHNSTAIEGQKEPEAVFNCPERLADGEKKGQKYLGPEKKEGHVLSDIMDEPISAIKAIAPSVKKMKLIGHSFGAGCVWNSVGQLKNDQEILQKITHMISLSGFLGEGKIDEKGIWQGLKMSLDELVDIEMEDEKEDGVHGSQNRERVKNGIEKLAKRMEGLEIPNHITQILVTSPEDKFIPLPSKFRITREGGREIMSFDYPGHTAKTIVVEDRTQKKKHHSLPGLLPENLIRGLQFDRHHGKWPKFVVVKEKVPKYERERGKK